jgi:UDP-N-acetylglucosamine:LPS N-acetylglucosamine transferase
MATLTGMPLRREIVELTKDDYRFEANQFFNLDSKLTTLLVTGG